MMYWGWGMGLVGMLFMIVFWALVVAGAIWLITRLLPRGGGHYSPPASGGSYSAPANWTPPVTQAETPLDILKRRYASGEITKAEYDQMRQDILADSR